MFCNLGCDSCFLLLEDNPNGTEKEKTGKIIWGGRGGEFEDNPNGIAKENMGQTILLLKGGGSWKIIQMELEKRVWGSQLFDV